MSDIVILAMCIATYIAGALITMLIGFYCKVKHHDTFFDSNSVITNDNGTIYWATAFWPLWLISLTVFVIIYPIYYIGKMFVSLGPKFEVWLKKPKEVIVRPIDETKSSYRRIVMK